MLKRSENKKRGGKGTSLGWHSALQIRRRIISRIKMERREMKWWTTGGRTRCWEEVHSHIWVSSGIVARGT